MSGRAEKGVRDAESVGVCFPRPLCVASARPRFMALLQPFAYCSHPDSLLQGSTHFVNPLLQASSRLKLWPLTLTPLPHTQNHSPIFPDFPLIHSRSNMCSFPHFFIILRKHLQHTFSHSHLSELGPLTKSRCVLHSVNEYGWIT